MALDGNAQSSDYAASSYATIEYWVYDYDFGQTVVDGLVYAYGDTTINDAIPTMDPRFYSGDRHLQIGYELVANSNAYLDEPGAHQTEADFYNTLHFRWDLAQGTSFDNSRSGYFSPGPIQTVPEPSCLLALGLGALPLLRRERGR